MWKPYKPYPEYYADEEVVLTLDIHSDDTYESDIPEYDFIRTVYDDNNDEKVNIEFVKKHMNEDKYKQGLLDYEVKVKQYREFLENKIKDAEKQLKFMGV
jgi:hypothetical protein